ncbi:MAG: DUF4388 domain-containing protein [Myxococcaceae bacterium]|nr:DUF4388 domain-containing protein [Myxococcaceae bacterium]
MTPLQTDPLLVLHAGHGTCAQTPLPVLLHALLAARRTCTLELHQQALEKRIFFEDGVPVACTSNLVQETLGRHLVDKGVLDEEQSRRFLAQSLQEGLPLGQVLVRAGVLDEAELSKHLLANLGRRILDSFRWGAATYRLVGLPTPAEASQKVNALQLIYTGVCSLMPLPEVQQGLAEFQGRRFARLHRPKHDFGQVRLSEKDQQFLALLSMRPDLAGFVAAGFTEEEAQRRLYAWLVLGLIDIADKVPEKAPEPESPVQLPRSFTPAPREAARLPPPITVDDEAAPPEAIAVPRRNLKPLWMALVLGGSALAGFIGYSILVRLGQAQQQPVPQAAAGGGAPVAAAASVVGQLVAPVPLSPTPALPPLTHKAALPARHFELGATGLVLRPPQLQKQQGLTKAFLEKGLRALGRSDLEAAVDAFAHASLDSPKDPEALYGAAYGAYELRKDEDALKAVTKALSFVPGHAKSLLLGAWLDHQAGKNDAAKAKLTAYLATPAPPDADAVKLLLSALE